MSSALAIFTLAHVALSLVGLFAGAVVVAGFLSARRLDGWTATFLATTVATSVTGFGFPVDHLLPSHVVGLISLVVLAAALFARYARNLAGAWRWIYVVTATVALYLNTFVAIVQAFLKIPVLTAIAPTQSEPPFLIAQTAALIVFVVLGIAAAAKFRPDVAARSKRAPAMI